MDFCSLKLVLRFAPYALLSKRAFGCSCAHSTGGVGTAAAVLPPKGQRRWYLCLKRPHSWSSSISAWLWQGECISYGGSMETPDASKPAGPPALSIRTSRRTARDYSHI